MFISHDSSLNPCQGDYFLLNPRNARFVSGKSRYPYWPYWWAVLISSAILAYSFVSFDAIYEYIIYPGYSNLILAISSETTGGLVTKLNIKQAEAKNGIETRYSVAYTFAGYDGKTYIAANAIAKAHYAELREGAGISITYAHLDPNVSVPTKDYPDVITVLAGIAVFCMFLACFWGFTPFSLCYLVWNYLSLSQNGKLITGKILEVEPVLTPSFLRKNLDYGILAKIYFINPDGERIERDAFTVRNDLKNKPLPLPDTPVPVLYLNEKRYVFL